MAQPPGDHGTLPDRTYEGLRDLIIRGRIREGDRVREADMARHFGVSRTPIREAFAQLVHEGYLAPISGGRRTELAVTPLDSESVRELWGLMGALEGYAIQAVTRIPDTPRLLVVADLKRINSELCDAAESRPRNQDRLFELQTAFHVRFVYESTGDRFRGVYDSVRPHVQRYEWVYGTRSTASYDPSISEHLRIIAAIRKGEPADARTAVESHWRNAAARTVRIIEEISQKHPRRAPRAKVVLKR